ncbi:hypothetical protein CMV_010039 [Castanea mollissima]|uniref:60S ribosomal protein L10a n=1 Tax=Castanea mollissima TaxID=60419 RepID=A0A8J4RIX6_9ROSI|nr:hypothetical protein CMV_010039 [Castanea mollissima]
MLDQAISHCLMLLCHGKELLLSFSSCCKNSFLILPISFINFLHQVQSSPKSWQRFRHMDEIEDKVTALGAFLCGPQLFVLIIIVHRLATILYLSYIIEDVNAGKFPTLVTHQESLESKVNETKAMVKFQLKKVLCMGVAVGNCSMEEKQIFQNVQMSVNFLVSLLKKNWQNVRCLNLKSTMGSAVRLY